MGLHYHALNCIAAVNGDPRRDVMKQMSVFVTLMQLPLVGSRSINQLVVSGNSTFSLLAMTRPDQCLDQCLRKYPSPWDSLALLVIHIVMLWFMFHEFSVIVKDTILFEIKT